MLDQGRLPVGVVRTPYLAAHEIDLTPVGAHRNGFPMPVPADVMTRPRPTQARPLIPTEDGKPVRRPPVTYTFGPPASRRCELINR
jgi:hypothetical protein